MGPSRSNLCPEGRPSLTGDPPTTDARRCRSELEKNADLRLYTTTIAMADLDEVRVALGYDRINVYGGSYGSTAALSYLNF